DRSGPSADRRGDPAPDRRPRADQCPAGPRLLPPPHLPPRRRRADRPRADRDGSARPDRPPLGGPPGDRAPPRRRPPPARARHPPRRSRRALADLPLPSPADGRPPPVPVPNPPPLVGDQRVLLPPALVDPPMGRAAIRADKIIFDRIGHEPWYDGLRRGIEGQV